MTLDWSRFRSLLTEHRRFLLTSHIRPDCDALGSELAMAQILEAIGGDVRIVNAQATPPNLAFLDPQRRIEVLDADVSAEQLEDREVLMILDTSAWAQLGAMGTVIRSTKAKRLILDHHVSEDDLQAEAFKDTSAEACGMLVLDAADQLGVPLTPQIAVPLLAAVATDTGWFRFASADSDTYRAAARLIDAGASPAAVFRELYERDTAARVRLRGVILSRVTCELGGRLAHTYVLKEDFESTGALPSDTEDVINMTLAIDGVEFAVIFVEQAAGGFKMSFRSRSQLDCSRIAASFGGGGHKAAAGASVAGAFEEVQPIVLDTVRAAMEAI